MRVVRWDLPIKMKKWDMSRPPILLDSNIWMQILLRLLIHEQYFFMDGKYKLWIYLLMGYHNFLLFISNCCSIGQNRCISYNKSFIIKSFITSLAENYNCKLIHWINACNESKIRVKREKKYFLFVEIMDRCPTLM